MSLQMTKKIGEQKSKTKQEKKIQTQKTKKTTKQP